MRQLFTRALHAFLERASRDHTIEGALVAGSYVNGCPGPYSDLDLFLLVAGQGCPAKRWATEVVLGVEIELSRDTYEGYLRTLEERRRLREVIHPLATGQILFDRMGRLADLRSRAGVVLRELSAREAPDSEKKLAAARPLVFGLRKIGNAYTRRDWVAFDSECGFVLHLVPRIALDLAGMRVVPAPIRSFEEEFPKLHAQWVGCLAALDRETRWNQLNELLREVFAVFAIGDLPRPIEQRGTDRQERRSRSYGP